MLIPNSENPINTFFWICEIINDLGIGDKGLKKLKALLDEGKITMDIIERQYQSWKGDKGKGKPGKRITFNSYYTLQRMDQLYNELFINKTNQGGTINE